MFILLKLSLSNILANKFRSFLIILSVALSSALIYAIMSLNTTTASSYSDGMTQTLGKTDILVTVSEDAAYPLMNELSNPSDYSTNMNSKSDYIIPNLQGYGYHIDNNIPVTVQLNGISLDHFKQIYTYDFINKMDGIFANNQMILGEKTAKDLGLSVGDTYDVNINGETISFEIWGIISDKNLLSKSSNMIVSIVPVATMETLLNAKGLATVYYIGLNDSVSTVDAIETFQYEYPDLSFNEAVDSNGLSYMMSMITTLLGLMTISVLLVSGFIIYSSFKIIIIERMPFIGTLRSLGLRKKDAQKVLLFESLTYSIIGSIFGFGLGMIILKFTFIQLTKSVETNNLEIHTFYPVFGLIACVVAIGLVFISSSGSIRNISKKPVKSLLFTEIESEKHFSVRRMILGACAIVIAFVLLNLKVKGLDMAFGFAAIILMVLGGSMMIPTVTMILSLPLRYLLKPFLGYHSEAAVLQIKQDKTLMNNIILLGMGLAVLLMINNISTSVGSVVTDVYSKFNSDVMLLFGSVDDDFIESLNTIDGVDHVYTTRETFDILANDGDVLFPILEGIDGPNFPLYAFDEFGDEMTPDIIASFQSKRSIMTSTLLADTYNLKVGDIVTMDFNGNKQDYEIILISTTMMNNGNMSYIYEDFFVEDTGTNLNGSVFINTDKDPEKLIYDIRQHYPWKVLNFTSLEEMEETNQTSNESLFALLRSVSLIAMLIGTIGIFNNYIISFISRRKFLASLRSLGVNKSSLMKLFMTESILSGMIGAIAGLAIGSLLLQALLYILEDMGIESALITYQPKEFIFIAISGIVLAFVSAILPSLSMLKRPIVTDLKYE